jgi:nucleoside-diphosphate-sugar epimerase
MRVFVAGATGALGRHLVPGLVAAGHQVTATTRTPGKAARLREAGAEPVVVDGLDREAVIAAVLAARPEEDPPASRPPGPSSARSLAALRQVEETVPLAAPEGIVLRYGGFVVALMTSWRGASNEKARKELGWEPRYPSWREGFRAWVSG